MSILFVPATKTFGVADIFDGHDNMLPKKTALIRAVDLRDELLVEVNNRTDTLTFVQQFK